MHFFSLGSRVSLKTTSLKAFFQIPTGVVVGYATTGSGVPCLIVSMDEAAQVAMTSGATLLLDRRFTDRLVVPMDSVEPL